MNRLWCSCSIGTDALEKELVSSSLGEKLNFNDIFRALSKNDHFTSNIWQKQPFLCRSTLQCVAGAFTMENVKENVDNDFLEAGRGTFNEEKGGWNMATVSEPRGRTFEEAKLRFEDVQMAMKAKSGTVVFNSAGGFIAPLADVCLQFTQAFDMPCAMNMYLTAAGQSTSAPPHTDKQDVFVLQTQGQKRWKVYAPPPPKIMFRADPFARGKGADQLDLRELSAEPLIDSVLSPGQLLYVPGGFPHTTDTLSGVSMSDPSVHLTVGLDTHIWGMSYQYLRQAVLTRLKLPDKVVLTKLDASIYWSLQECLPLGFLTSSNSARDNALAKLAMIMTKTEPKRWADISQLSSIIKNEGKEIWTMFEKHHRDVTDTFVAMYSDVGTRRTVVPGNLSFLRSKPYFDRLEGIMGRFVSKLK